MVHGYLCIRNLFFLVLRMCLLVVLSALTADAYVLTPPTRAPPPIAIWSQGCRDCCPMRSRAYENSHRKRRNRMRLQGSVSSNNQEDSSQDSKGSVLGASLLFAGTAIGAGMIALPAETASSGFVPSIASLLMCWAFTVVTSFVTLEASWTVGKDDSANSSEKSCGFLTIMRTTLGPVGEIVTALLFWFLLTAIVVAYTSGGGELISEFVQEQVGGDPDKSIDRLLSPQLGSTVFMAFFASLAIFGTEWVDFVNRVLVIGLLAAFVGLLGIGFPQIDTSLLVRGDWQVIYPQVISVGILAFGAQNVVPTLLQYLGGDASRTQRAILVGSLIPLVMYSLWECIILGSVPWDPSMGSSMEVVSTLGSHGGGRLIQELVEVFSACAIGSSMAGASVSLVDFFQDALSSRSNDEEAPSTGRRLVAAMLALVPPLGVAFAYPDAFLSVLETVGLVCGVSLYGVLPSLAVIQLRKTRDKEAMPGRIGGGASAFYCLLVLSAVLLVPDVIQLGRGFLQ